MMVFISEILNRYLSISEKRNGCAARGPCQEVVIGPEQELSATQVVSKKFNEHYKGQNSLTGGAAAVIVNNHGLREYNFAKIQLML